MGNREALLAGARQCLAQKGYAATTVRDIAAAAGVSMAAIGYHFGSREALLNAAMIQAFDEWGAVLGAALTGEVDAPADPDRRYAADWGRIIATFSTHRALWLASLEALVHAQRSPELRSMLATGQRAGRRGIAAGLLGVAEEEVPDERLRTIGSVQLALLTGVMAQWLADPEYAPDGAEILTGLRDLVAGLAPAAKPADA